MGSQPTICLHNMIRFGNTVGRHYREHVWRRKAYRCLQERTSLPLDCIRPVRSQETPVAIMYSCYKIAQTNLGRLAQTNKWAAAVGAVFCSRLGRAPVRHRTRDRPHRVRTYDDKTLWPRLREQQQQQPMPPSDHAKSPTTDPSRAATATTRRPRPGL